MKPEQRSRALIDGQLQECGWVVQNHSQMNISAAAGVAVREFPLSTGHADYLLYVHCKALGVVEAKPEGHPLTGVESQSGSLRAAVRIPCEKGIAAGRSGVYDVGPA